MKQFIFLTTIFLVLLTSCKKDKTVTYNIPCNTPTSDATISSSLIVGKWKWVSEYRCPFGAPCSLLTPVSEGYTKDRVFDKQGIHTFYKNGVLLNTIRYSFVLEKEITLYPLDNETVLKLTDAQTGAYLNYVHFRICNDTLTLNWQIRSDAVGQEKWAKY
ncbi:MAG: hypothetical protein JNM14_11080 [Ferruginibacter sp.]|nr:hypothetical protein [Ferruginibacter sp.]